MPNRRGWSRWVLLLLLGFSLMAIFTRVSATEAVAPSPHVFSVIVDAGHGGFDGGASSDEGLLEKDVNLAISDCLADLILLCGGTVYQTRTSDAALNTENLSGGAAKTADIKARLALFDTHPESLVLSVHQNHYSESQYSGAQMFYGVHHAESVLFAQTLQHRFYQLQPDNTREIKEAPSSVYLLQQAENPMVLAECGFLSNPTEAALLSTTAHQTAIAVTLLGGVVDFLTGQQLASTDTT